MHLWQEIKVIYDLQTREFTFPFIFNSFVKSEMSLKNNILHLDRCHRRDWYFVSHFTNECIFIFLKILVSTEGMKATTEIELKLIIW